MGGCVGVVVHELVVDAFMRACIVCSGIVRAPAPPRMLHERDARYSAAA
jgi:hypothetical protein